MTDGLCFSDSDNAAFGISLPMAMCKSIAAGLPFACVLHGKQWTESRRIPAIIPDILCSETRSSSQVQMSKLAPTNVQTPDLRRSHLGAAASVTRPQFDWLDRSEERRVGKECRSRWSPYH